ncbi:MAG: DHH family phosphoesterase [Deltaproteobacteria bacterium]|nr:DHH family phosphoesterase [Deltaproteobacteria bacterium]
MTMDESRIDAFRGAMKAAAAMLTEEPGRDITVVHHNDTDGIASGAILRQSLMRAGFSVESIPIERVHPAFLPAIHTPGRRLILYADLGGQAADVISNHIQEGARVVVIDHHLPAPGSFPRLLQVNPESFGIDGDGECAAAAAACFFAWALDRENEDLAALAVLGAVGDRQMAGGRFAGLNAILFEKAVYRGELLKPEGGDDAAESLFPRFANRNLRETDRLLISLSVNGYYGGGADLALDACVNGPDERTLAFSAEMASIQEERFSREVDTIRREGLSRQGRICSWDVGRRFHPLGLKAIGLFCEEIIRAGLAEGDFYVAGFQDFPTENPYLGPFAGHEAKVSFRVTAGLRRSIEGGESPDLMQLVPGAVRQVGGFAEACHRFSAACTIPGDRRPELIALLAERTEAGG